MDTQLTREDAPRLHQWLSLEASGAWEGAVPDWAKDHLGQMNDMTALRAVNEELLTLAQSSRAATFQIRSTRWGAGCMGAELVMRKITRVYRFFEETCELAQSLGMSASEALRLVMYVWSRRIGEPFQEAGAAVMTLALLCQAHGMDMMQAGEAELARVSEPTLFERIRAKAHAAPADSSLPVTTEAEAAPEIAALVQALAERDALRAELDRCKSESHGGAVRWNGEPVDLESLDGEIVISAADLRALLGGKSAPRASQKIVAAARAVGEAAAHGTLSTGHVHVLEQALANGREGGSRRGNRRRTEVRAEALARSQKHFRGWKDVIMCGADSADIQGAAVHHARADNEPDYEALEREHLGDADNGTGIYAKPVPIAQAEAVTPDTVDRRYEAVLDAAKNVLDHRVHEYAPNTTLEQLANKAEEKLRALIAAPSPASPRVSVHAAARSLIEAVRRNALTSAEIDALNAAVARSTREHESGV